MADAFSSPSALLLGAGITPSPAAAEGLGVTLGGGGRGGGMARLRSLRDGDEERRRCIEEVIHTLHSRVVGRGVCREGVERLARLEGFESIWQEDNISIAGNFVDLEVAFIPGRDAVKDVSLRYAAAEVSEEGVGGNNNNNNNNSRQREDATAVLKRGLVQPVEEREQGFWKPMDSFHENLRWLANMDKLSQEINCFEAIEGLYVSLKRVWEEEETAYPGDYTHICRGFVGQPRLHKGSRIGLGLNYWVEQSVVLDEKRKRASADNGAMDIDNQQSDQIDETRHKVWAIKIECEKGYPSLRVSKDWVNSEQALTTADANNDNNDMRVNWADPPDPMAIGSGILEGPAPNRRFVARIKPAVHVPVLVASEVHRLLGAQLPQDFKVVMYDDILVPGSTADARRCSGMVQVNALDTDGKPFSRRHRYAFQAFESVGGRTLHSIPFSHPRQLEDIIPVLYRRRCETVEPGG